jgi:hypothetical protein
MDNIDETPPTEIEAFIERETVAVIVRFPETEVRAVREVGAVMLRSPLTEIGIPTNT